MGSKVFAVAAILAVIVFIGINDAVVSSRIDEITEDIESCENYEDAARTREKFMKYERYISITVSHGDLTNIEDLLSEYEAQMRDGNDDAEITKSRLINALSHLRRLSGINIDSIV